MKIHKHKLMKSRFIFLSVIFLSPASVFADEVEELIITRVYSANNTSPVTYKDIARSQLQAAVQLQEASFFLQKTPSIISYSDAGSYQGYSYFRLRGIDQTRINMTLDGIPLNEPEDQGVYFSNYPGIFNSLEKIQIQRGVGTSQNGTASYAGAIQLLSADLKQPQKTELETSYASFNTLSGAAEFLSGVEQGKGFYVNLSAVDSEGYKFHSGNKSHSIFFSGISEDDSGAWKALAFSGKQVNDLAWVGVEESLIHQNRRNNANTDRENDRYEQSLLSFAREQKLNDALQLEVRTYFNKLHGSYDFDFNNFIGLPSTDELYNYKLDADFYGIYSNIHYHQHDFDISSGIHINHYKRDHMGSEKALGELYSNTGYRDSYAAFIKASYYFDALTLFADVQYRYSDFDYEGSVKFAKMDWSFVNPRLGLSYRFDSDWLAYYSLGKTKREPTRTDLFAGMDNLELNEDGEPILSIVDPETVIDHELGLRYEGMHFRLDANIFYMDFDNEITLNGSFGPNGLLLNQDVDRSIRKGVESTLELDVSSNLLWKASVTGMRAQIQDQNQSFYPVMTPEFIASSSLEYQYADYSLGIDLRHQGEAYINLANTEKVPEFTVVNVYGAYQYKGVEIKLVVNNIFDKDYLTSGIINASGNPAYFVGAPVNYSLSLRKIME
jgi:iron complex outermembrane recepter protein